MKNKIWKNILSFLFLFMSAFSYAGVKCTRPTVGFFNGMLNNITEASRNFAELQTRLYEQNAIFTQYRMPFNYVLFYNNTEGISKDINEVFKQLKKEEENGTILNPRTEKDYKNHEMLVADALQKGTGLLLVGHSQGNFFLNHIYEYCKNNAPRSVPCEAIQVGSPSSKNYGAYYLSNNDIIIQSFYRITGREFRPNVAIPYSTNDLTGHGFIKTYLDKSKPAERLIVEKIADELLHFCPFV